ncbi:hypothetical protein [Amycolatopsis sp. NPDC021455]|uniref:hypothetical protein n=1 Tax=Amycolatopsis sp. NPDC021455 TaxID=3154901 RepID=UPI0033CEB865
MSEYRETLVSPKGRTVTVTSPGEYNDLIYGRGYRPVGDADQSDNDTADETADETEAPDESVREDDAPSDQ